MNEKALKFYYMMLELVDTNIGYDAPWAFDAAHNYLTSATAIIDTMSMYEFPDNFDAWMVEWQKSNALWDKLKAAREAYASREADWKRERSWYDA